MAALAMQQMFWCACGASTPHAKGRCRRCYDLRRRSLLRFAGRREQVLARDGSRCVLCWGPPVVHHRPRGFITLCPRCHARVHHSPRLLFGMPALLETLWREKHPRQAEQFLLPEFSIQVPEVVLWQPSLFAA